MPTESIRRDDHLGSDDTNRSDNPIKRGPPRFRPRGQAHRLHRSQRRTQESTRVEHHRDKMDPEEASQGDEGRRHRFASSLQHSDDVEPGDVGAIILRVRDKDDFGGEPGKNDIFRIPGSHHQSGGPRRPGSGHRHQLKLTDATRPRPRPRWPAGVRGAASSATARPSTKTRVIFVFSSKRLPSVTTRFAALPFSIEPRRSATPAMVAASSVSARIAASSGRPALTAFAGVLHEVLRIGQAGGLRTRTATPAFASSPGAFGASARSRSVSSGSSASGAACAAAPGSSGCRSRARSAPSDRRPRPPRSRAAGDDRVELQLLRHLQRAQDLARLVRLERDRQLPVDRRLHRRRAPDRRGRVGLRHAP